MLNRFRMSVFPLLLAILFIAGSADASTIGFGIKIRFGHGKDCEKRRGICSIEFVVKVDQSGMSGGNADGSVVGNMLEISMLEPIPREHLMTRGKKSWLVLEEDVAFDLSPEAARELGTQSLTIQKGTYEVRFGSNRNGEFSLKLRSYEKATPKLQQKSTRGR